MRPELFLAAILLPVHIVAGATHTDPDATQETQNLYENLKLLTTSDKVAFGQQFTTWRGVNADGTPWEGVPNKSDIKTMTGKFPAVCGWNVETILKLAPADRGNFIQRIKDDHARNMIITFHWVMRNPATGGSKKDTTGSKAGQSVPAQATTPGSVANKNLRADLDDFAAFLNLLRDPSGRPIPIIFRPFHEMNGGGNWWSTGKIGDEADYVALWRYTVSYLRDTKHVHQLLYVYAPAGSHFMKNSPDDTRKTTDRGRTAAYLLNWPGDDFVDICGIDLYLKDKESVGDIKDSGWNTTLNFVYAVAQARSMPCAFTELGPKRGLDKSPSYNNRWWTSRVLADFNLSSRPVWNKCAYMLTWGGDTPKPGSKQTADFIEFTQNPHILMQPDLPPMYTKPATATKTAKAGSVPH